MRIRHYSPQCFSHAEKIIEEFFEKRRQLDAKRRVAVGPAARLASVDEHLRKAHRAVRLEEHALRAPRRGQRERPPVGAAADRLQVGVVVGVRNRERLVNAPVMRHAHRPPSLARTAEAPTLRKFKPARARIAPLGSRRQPKCRHRNANEFGQVLI